MLFIEKVNMHDNLARINLGKDYNCNEQLKIPNKKDFDQDNKTGKIKSMTTDPVHF